MAGLFDTGANALLGIGQGTVQPQTNQLQNIAAAQAVRNQALEYQNALLGQKAKLAQGNALLGATDASGRVDYAKARATMARDPDAAYGAAAALHEQNASRHDDVLNQDEQLSFQEHARNAAAGAFIRAAENPTDANIRGTGAFIARLTPGARDQIETATRGLLSLPTAAQRSEAIKTLATSTLPGHEQISQTFGTPTSVDDGQTIQTGTQASGMDGGAFTPATGVQRQTSPEFNAAPTEIINPDGSRSYVRREQVVGGAQGRPTVPPEVMGSGRYPTAQPANPGYQAAPAAGQVESQRAAAEVAGHAAGDQFGQAGQLSAGFGDRMYRSQKALQLLQEISPASGKPAELHNRIVNVAVSLGMTTPSDKAAAYDEANKYLTQLAASQPGAAHSDAQLATALAGNPSTHINNLAAQDALRANIALDRRANAAYLAFHQQYPGTAAQVHANEWPAFQNDYTTKKDARAFMFDIMTPEQRARLWSSMDGKQRQAFRSELRGAMATGLVQAPN
ncbi:hypothetical protein [Gluconobacter roseus]|uniref:Uncharacterized protein n=1 Tax=Gluconobacter roseus NBRC 3990 TaxID=1307950 RepID=A0A4Y3M9K0_9PROT|nr:hypothetical protein [Gluconobacter roseus]KXV43059.1 hypothetical protein AD943_08705 [Gluconobacter roseus]GBR43384.1 hypothetical protein AA3990_0408 [Gluconobacter roseus NBRC 3990]GEB03941.1 hypothetical protein GRO01_15170 [Gluconobacter roseus NBRC 3990]GLP94394.1 hypothetical protein GCM10007871_23720 [Gluconobacter roseus NBRC 3990]